MTYRGRGKETMALSSDQRQRVLQSIQHFCTEKNCFRDGQPDAQVMDTFRQAEQNIRLQMKSKHKDDEDIATAIYDYSLILNNAAYCFRSAEASHTKKPLICFVTRDDRPDVAMGFLAGSCQVEENYAKLTARRKANRTLWKTKRFIAVFAALFLVFLSIFVSGMISQPPDKNEPEAPVTDEREGPIEWIRYNLLGQERPPKPEPNNEKKGYPMSSIISGIAIIFLAMGSGVYIVYQVKQEIKEKKITQEWGLFQEMRQVFGKVYLYNHSSNAAFW